MQNCKIARNWLTCLLDYTVVRRQMRTSNREKGCHYKLSSLIFFSCGLEITCDNILNTVLKRHQSKKPARSRTRKERKTVFNWWEARKTIGWREVSGSWQWIRQKRNLNRGQLTGESRIPADWLNQKLFEGGTLWQLNWKGNNKMSAKVWKVCKGVHQCLIGTWVKWK